MLLPPDCFKKLMLQKKTAAANRVQVSFLLLCLIAQVRGDLLYALDCLIQHLLLAIEASYKKKQERASSS